MEEASRKGTPVMRPLFYDFPADPVAWDVKDQFMFGPDVLVAPVMEPGVRMRPVYLPVGTEWKDLQTGAVHAGGQTLTPNAPLGIIPVFVRRAADEVWGMLRQAE
jgi:alpha-D-xyloside xylohydrolase